APTGHLALQPTHALLVSILANLSQSVAFLWAHSHPSRFPPLHRINFFQCRRFLARFMPLLCGVFTTTPTTTLVVCLIGQDLLPSAVSLIAAVLSKSQWDSMSYSDRAEPVDGGRVRSEKTRQEVCRMMSGRPLNWMRVDENIKMRVRSELGQLDTSLLQRLGLGSRGRETQRRGSERECSAQREPSRIWAPGSVGLGSLVVVHMSPLIKGVKELVKVDGPVR
ncbi:hypothetical protein B0H11DRAFT_2355779, partial [Mycena galericulata]